jgi:nitrogen fixation/metabolism regulation signal transduction histidine kinase
VLNGTCAGELQVSVADHRIGIAPEGWENIINSYTTTKPQGLDLGLTVCRTIIEAHGGHIDGANNSDRAGQFFASRCRW